MRKILVAIIVAVVIITVVFVLSSSESSESIESKDTSKFIFNGQLSINELPQIDINDDTYRSYNPSTCSIGDEKLITQRVSNYTGCGQSKPHIAPNDVQSFIVINFMDKLLRVVTESVAPAGCPQGFEDARPVLSQNGEELYLFCSAKSSANCTTAMWLLKINVQQLHAEDVYVEPTECVVLTTDISQDNHEKNWMPFITENGVYMVYSVNPHIILQCDVDTGNCEMVSKTFNPSIKKSLRGGSQLKLLLGHGRTPNMYVGAIHERKQFLSYVTRFYAFKAVWPFQVLKISDEFVFNDDKEEVRTCIQFAAGLDFTWNNRYLSSVTVSYGEHDCHSKICVIDGTEFVNALNDVDQSEMEVLLDQNIADEKT